MEGDQPDSQQASGAPQPQATVVIATPQEELIVRPLHNQSQAQTGAIIVKVNPQTGFTSSSKLKSLLPKGLVSNFSKAGVTSLPFRDVHDANIDPDLVNSLISSPELLNPALRNKSSQPVLSSSSSSQAAVETASQVVRSEGIEHILQNFGGNVLTLPFSEDSKDCAQDQAKENLSHPIGDEGQDTSEGQTALKNDNSDASVNVDKDSSSSSQQASFSFDEKEQDSDVIRKTMVEAFVKMVVCRKVTVQRVHAKTGQVLDTNVKTEEEDPVILGVDCVETTEDLASSSSATETKGTSANDLSTTKWNASLDGGLKFLSAVSESRQKIGKSLIKDKLIKSALQSSSLSKIPASVNKDTSIDFSKAEESFTLKVSRSTTNKPEVKTEIKEESDFEWDEDLNDDSEDFVPNSSVTTRRTSSITTRNQKTTTGFSSSLSSKEDSKSDSVILLPKKRGRKRKWDNALGLSSNLRRCQFCSKLFKSVQACAKHMKKGECISSVFCFICSKALNDERELEEHLSSHRNESKSSSYSCEDCHREYRTKAGYLKHFRMGTCQKRKSYEDGSTGEFLCDICESRFSSEDYLKLHRYKVHENPRDTHDCPDCGRKFYSYAGFQKHRNTKSCTEPLKCHICGKTYSNKAKESFKIHMKHHKSEVTGLTFNCEECGRAYMTQMALNKHKLSHTGVKPYKCETCGKEFSMRYMVKDHARMHTGERPFLCSLCGSAFSNKGHLGRHLRSHENGTLLKRGRPKKIREPQENLPQETELKMIDLRDALQGFDGQSIQVVDGQVFDAQGNSTPMIIQADNNTIIIAEGWPEAAGANPTVGLDGTHEIVNVTNNIVPNLSV
ncbi:zinc finger protein 616 [Aplysia californica]|uniref:Zinc finger protein 616 n=1 Tax=Aplysia californica TaxID=6500 RepID=A0ABM0JLJ6_APLCA|nr:zinc finger protein 616 [Aplysia californica]